MNRINTSSNGGFKFVLEDLDFFDASVRESFRGVMAALGVDTFANSFIITGCAISGGPSFVCSAGWICLKGEILPVDAHTLPVPAVGQIRFWSVEETDDSAGAKPTYDGSSTIQAYKVRKGKVVVGAAPSDYLPVSTTNTTATFATRIFDKVDALRKFARIQQEAWHVVGTSGEPAFGSGFSGTMEFYKDEFGNVHIRGAASTTNAFGVANTIFTLPAGYTIPANREFAVGVIDGSSNKDIVLMEVITDGRVRLFKALGIASMSGSYTANFEISFSTL